MKKVLLVAVAGLFVLASCKKSYTCTCVSPAGTTEETFKGKDATDACNDGTSVFNAKVCTPKQ